MPTLKKAVLMDANGRLTLPADARRHLRLKGEAEFIVEFGDQGILLRPALTIPREDVWAYTPEHMAVLRRALEDEAQDRIVPGRVRDLPSGD